MYIICIYNIIVGTSMTNKYILNFYKKGIIFLILINKLKKRVIAFNSDFQ
jgi:hypothetical protein